MAKLQPGNASWHRFLPRSVRDRIHGRAGLQAILGNSAWLMADKIVRMGMGLVVGIWVTRYLGPTQFGQLAYSWAFAGIVGAFATLGMDSIVVRELVNRPDARDRILGSAFVIRFIGGLVALATALIAVSILRPGDESSFILIAIATGGFVVQSLNVIDFYFQSKVLSRNTVMCAMVAFVVTTIARVILLLIHAPLIWFALCAMGDMVLASLFLLMPYARQKLHIFQWSFDALIARRLLLESWPITLALMANFLFMRVDQIMIGQMLDETEVGLFAASVKLTEIWYFIPAALMSSVFPALLTAKQNNPAQYRQRLQLMFDVMCWLGMTVGIVATLLAHWVIPLMYGHAFARTADVFTIQVWAGVALAMACVYGNWLVLEGLQRYFLFYTPFALVVNVIGNLMLIPKLGIQGAALATLFAQFSPMLLQVALPRTRGGAFMMFSAFWAPVRLCRSMFSLRSI